MLRSKGKIAGVLASVLVFSLFSAGSPATSASGDSSCWDFKRKDRRFARKMNAERADAGLGRLKLDPELSRVAKVQTRKMIKESRLYHSPTSRLTDRVTNWTMLGENVGTGGTVASLHSAFMNSSAHAANVLNAKFSNVGVFAKRRDGRLWVTVLFEASKNPGTTYKMPC